VKINKIVVISLAALAWISAPTYLIATTDEDQSPRDRDAVQYQGTPRLGALWRANHIIGAEVRDTQGGKLGKVEDLALDLENGRVAEVIVATGGLMGMDVRLFAVPPASFGWDDDKKILRFNADKSRFQNAPEFPLASWSEATTAESVRDIYQRYGAEPYFKSDRDTSSQPPAAAGGQVTRSYHFNGENAAPHIGYLVRASRVIETSVINNQNEKLARVNDFMINLPEGRLVEVILAKGGFLGMGRQYTAVPPESFRWNDDRKDLCLDTTKAALETAPHFKASQWNYATDPGRVVQVYSLYNVEPYFVMGTTDVGAQNVRERMDDKSSPLNQGNNADLSTTSQIRSAVLANANISQSASKIQIMTSDGKVTLIGPVASVEEKRQIGEAAAKVVGADNVDNQLEIRGTPDSTIPPEIPPSPTR